MKASTIFTLLLCGTLSPRLLAGENILFNPEFNNPQMEAGWTSLSGALPDWTIGDADGCAGSGAGRIASTTTDIGTQWAEVGQCRQIDAAAWTTGFHAAFSYLSDQPLTLAYADYLYYTDAGCGFLGGSWIGQHNAPAPIGPGWQRAAISVPTIPPLAQSVLVAVGAEAYQLDPMELSFDRAYFGPEPVLFTDDFEAVASLCRWSSAVP